MKVAEIAVTPVLAKSDTQVVIARRKGMTFGALGGKVHPVAHRSAGTRIRSLARKTVELNKVCDAASCFLRASPLSIQG
jgi:hypothetical protein